MADSRTAREHFLLTRDDERYPERLREIADPPDALYVAGRVELLNAPIFAIVGSRNATLQGRRDAEAFARVLSAEGLTIASGMALGVDAAAHRGALAEAASSIAVLGTGIDVVYPEVHAALADELARKGCLVSEFPPGTPPIGWNFPRRNRLISGLALGVLVVEANEESGSLVTARCALDQDRDVFAIPGSIHSTLAKGCHKLIKEGATLVENAADILAVLNWRSTVASCSRQSPPPAHPLLEAMGFGPISIDEIAALTGIAVNAITAQLSRLEVDGLVAALPGGRYQRCAV